MDSWGDMPWRPEERRRRTTKQQSQRKWCSILIKPGEEHSTWCPRKQAFEGQQEAIITLSWNQDNLTSSSMCKTRQQHQRHPKDRSFEEVKRESYRESYQHKTRLHSETIDFFFATPRKIPFKGGSNLVHPKPFLSSLLESRGRDSF
jgi:hypothetical protein